MPSTPPSLAPIHCPNPDCESLVTSRPWRFIKKGFYERDRRRRRIQRYQCQHCDRNFSSQTFATDYWLRRDDLLEPVFHRFVAWSRLRQIVRNPGGYYSAICRLADGLGRHCVLFQEKK